MLPELKQKSVFINEALKVLTPGLKLYGYCGGLFGRDSYGEKEIKEVRVCYSVDGDIIQLTVIEDGILDCILLDDKDEVTRLINYSNSSMEKELKDDEL